MKLLFEDAIHINNEIVFLAKNINLMCSIRIGDGKLKVYGRLPEGNVWDSRLCGGIAEYRGNIVIAPLKARNIWIFSLSSKEWKRIPLHEYDYCKEKTYFRNIYVDKQKLLLIGGYYPAIIVFDIETGKLEYHGEMFKNIKANGNDLFFRSGPVEIGNKLLFASCINNSILEFDKETYQYEWISIGRKENRYSGIVYDGKYFWLSPRNNSSIVRWDGKDTQYIEVPKNKERTGVTYSGIVSIDDYFVIPSVPGCQSGSIVVDRNCQVAEIDERYTLCKRLNFGECIRQTEKGKVVYRDAEGEDHEYSLEFDDNDFFEILSFSGIDRKEYINGMIIEGEDMNLDTWICILKENQ